MIPSNIDTEEDLEPYLRELGFRAKKEYSALEDISVSDNVMLYFSNNKSIGIYYFEPKEGDIILVSDKQYQNEKCIGYKNVINFLNEDFKEYYRKEKITRLLNDTK
jgi:hypothetical protein